MSVRRHPRTLRTLFTWLPLAAVMISPALAAPPAWPPLIAGQTTRVRPVISSVALSPDGTQLVTAGDDHLVRTWSLVTGEHLQTLRGHRDWVRSACFTPDGQTIISGGNDKRLISWSLASGSQQELPAPGFAVARLAISPAGDRLAVAGFADRVLVYDVPQRTILQRLVTGCPDMRAISFSADGKQLAAAGRDGRILLWDLASGELLADPRWHGRRVRDLVFSPDGSTIYSVAEDRTLHAWNLLDVDRGFTLTLGPGKTMAIALCGPNHVATAGSDNQIRVWDIEGRRLETVLRGHTGSVATLAAGKNRLISAGFDTTVRSWNIQPGESRPILSAQRQPPEADERQTGGNR